MKAPEQRPEHEPERAAIKAPLRVGIISPYSFETPGGVQLHIRDFARHLMERGHQVQVLAPGRRTQDMPLWVQTTGSSFSIPYNGSVANLSYFGVAGHKTRQWVRQGHFDILHLHEPEVPSLSHKPLRPGFIPCPYVATFHAAFDSTPLALRLTRRYLRRYLANISQAIFVSPSAMQNARNLLEPGIPSQIIPNGIETRALRNARPRPEWQGSEREPTIGFLGRMKEERKGFRILAQAAPAILRRVPGARFLCAGDGQGEAREILEAVDPGLARHFTFLGRISDEDKASFYHSLGLYVAPQTGGESFGIVLVEAMAAGCPVVASDLPAFKDVSQNGHSARLFANEDPEDCARVVLELLDDRPTRLDLASCGMRRASDYDWERVTDQVLDVYARALAARPDHRRGLLGRLVGRKAGSPYDEAPTNGPENS